ncbi:hypothetical protein ZHAS_00021167 [Anopheles sinensis]|uniref:Uncharacterized protein n=1 Tax=Anopheles sinensis TaxID=74873 RepID=A0A084WRL3_ANOSI|nr:hypothetical protein ZHAS_00021167 [Anopheles sinensis]
MEHRSPSGREPAFGLRWLRQSYERIPLPIPTGAPESFAPESDSLRTVAFFGAIHFSSPPPQPTPHHAHLLSWELGWAIIFQKLHSRVNIHQDGEIFNRFDGDDDDNNDGDDGHPELIGNAGAKQPEPHFLPPNGNGGAVTVRHGQRAHATAKAETKIGKVSSSSSSPVSFEAGPTKGWPGVWGPATFAQY